MGIGVTGIRWGAMDTITSTLTRCSSCGRVGIGRSWRKTVAETRGGYMGESFCLTAIRVKHGRKCWLATAHR
jgi:hypothetical protein